MKLYTTLLTILLSATLSYSQTYKPYVLGAESSKSLLETKSQVKGNLKAQGFNILGEYLPANDASRWVIIVSSDEMVQAVTSIGELTGFAASLRIGLTQENDKILISYTNPYYWGSAYFRKDFYKVKGYYDDINEKLIKAVSQTGTSKGIPFGSEKGIEAEDLHDYRYMFGMPRMDDTVLLAEFSSFEEACASIDKNLSLGLPNIQKVYSTQVPGKKLKLYGIALNGEKGEERFLPIIDIGDPKHTAFLPYEFLVMGNEVHMLHGRYRIALSFPDLKMMTFTKIMSTPGDIKDLMKSVIMDVSSGL